MKRLALLAMAVMTVSAPAFAGHGTTAFVSSGKIAVGTFTLTTAHFEDPALGGDGSYAPQGKFTQDCSPANPREGVDLVTIALPAGSEGHDLTLTATARLLGDVDAWFLDANCKYIEGTGLVTLGGEEGVVPAGAAFVEIDLFNGLDATYVLRIEDVLP